MSGRSGHPAAGRFLVEEAVERLLDAFAEYSRARMKLLELLSHGNRDPLADFSEHLVARLVDGNLADSRVQKGWDILAGDELIQVKYLANTAGDRWVNEITIRSVPGVDRFALVVYESFVPMAVLMFPSDLGGVCSELGKRHPDQSSSLQFTRRNFLSIMDRPKRFEELGVQVVDLTRTAVPSEGDPPVIAR
jgi:hypothetical protein